jgi:hypothetical protein
MLLITSCGLSSLKQTKIHDPVFTCVGELRAALNLSIGLNLYVQLYSVGKVQSVMS